MSSPQTSDSYTSLQALFGFLRRNLVLIALIGGFVTFWMLVYTFAAYKPAYAAKALVIIKDSAITSRYVEPEQYYALQTTSSSSSNPVLNTMGIMKSGAIRDAVWEYFQTSHPEQLKKNKIKTKADWDSFFQDGSAFIKAKNQPGTDLIAIQFAWSDPIIAKETLEVVVKAFQEASRDLNKEEQISRTKFLEKQVTEIEVQLADIRRQKSEYQSKTKTVSIQREGNDLAGSRMELSNRLNQLEAQARGKENLIRRYQSMIGMSPEKALRASAIGQNATLARLQDELYRLEQLYSQLNSTLTETNPKVQEVKAQIEQVRANIAVEQTRTLGGKSQAAGSDNTVVADSTRNTLVAAMSQAQGEVQDLRTQAAVIRNRLAQVESKIENFPEIAESLTNIEQKESSLSTALDHLRQKVMEGRLKEEQTLSNVFIVDAPRLPEKASFPTRTHLLALSLLLGLGCGLASALAKEQFFSPRVYQQPAWLEALDDSTGYHPLDSLEDELSKAITQAKPAMPQTVPSTAHPSKASDYPTTQPASPSARPINQPQPTTPTVQRQQPQVAMQTPQMPVQGRKVPSSIQPRQTQKATSISQPVRGASTSIDDSHLLPPALPTPTKIPVEPTRNTGKVVRQVAAPQQLPATNAPRIPVDRPGTVNNVIPTLHAIESTEAATPVSPVTSNNPIQQQDLPFGRKTRGIPAFLLGEEKTAMPISRKSLLTPGDDLLSDVVPIAAPADESTLAARRPEPAWDVEPASRKPLVSAARRKYQTTRNPEAYFGLSARGSKKQGLGETPNRLLKALYANQTPQS